MIYVFCLKSCFVAQLVIRFENEKKLLINSFKGPQVKLKVTNVFTAGNNACFICIRIPHGTRLIYGFVIINRQTSVYCLM